MIVDFPSEIMEARRQWNILRKLKEKNVKSESSNQRKYSLRIKAKKDSPHPSKNKKFFHSKLHYKEMLKSNFSCISKMTSKRNLNLLEQIKSIRTENMHKYKR